MMEIYNRYDRFDYNGVNRVVPRINIDVENTDLVLEFNKNTMRMDMLSYKYYGNPNYGWLILLANPSYPSLEYLIPDGVQLRIPYPLGSAIRRYERRVDEYLKEHDN